MKKLISVVTAIAATVALGSATLMNANAVGYGAIDRNSEEYINKLSYYTKIDDSGLWEPYEGACYNVYQSKTYPSDYLFELIEESKFEFTMSRIYNADEYETVVQSILDKFNPEYEIDKNFTSEWLPQYTITDKNLNSETLKNARAVCAELKEAGLIESFTYYGDLSRFEDRINYSPTIYPDSYLDELFEDPVAVLEEYIAKNELDCKVIEVSDGDEFWDAYPTSGEDAYCVVPNTEMTIEEQFSLSKQIKDDLGINDYTLILESVSSETYATTTDLFNTVFGDITADDAVDLYDVIEIAKSLIGARTFTDSEQLIADFNNDGEVDLYDAIGIAKILMI